MSKGELEFMHQIHYFVGRPVECNMYICVDNAGAFLMMIAWI